MKKVGIVSCYFKSNYGSMLQAYATQKIIDMIGLENETFDISENIDFRKGKKKYYKTQIFNYSFWKAKYGMIWLKIYKKFNKKLGANISKREKKYKEFQREFNLTKKMYSYDEMSKASNNYSSIVVGSDQLWLPVNIVADYYTLNWVPDEINKISYATSFGVSIIPDKYKDKYAKFLKRINYISVREKNACELVEQLSDRKAELVCDPTLLLNKDEWAEIYDKKPLIEDKYILCYFLGKNIKHRKFAEKLREKTGYKIVSLNHADEYVKYSDKFADITPYDIGPKEFLNLIRNAEYVCTDSFHGTVFSLINNKKFFTFERYSSKNAKMSTNSRIYSLLKIVNLENRLLKGTENLEEVDKIINFEEVNNKIEDFRSKSKNFLKNALKTSFDEKNNKNNFIELNYKEDCCGCTACKSICPQNAIEMEEDEEGFLYPTINKDKCINCGLCKKTCPIINKNEKNEKEQKAFIINNKNDEIRRESTSGGAFTPIAEYIINKGGVVFGATFDNNYNVIHTYVDKAEELYKFRGSKYVQSDLKDTFKEVKKFLDNNRYVCFSGTPCQIEGLKKYLGKEYSELITVDIVCHAVPSPLVWKKYLKFIKSKYKNAKIKKILFRDKSKYGYKYSTMTIKGDNIDYSQGVETDPYLRAFFGDLSDRPSCYNCKFKKQYRVSDLTIWDCFEPERFKKELDDDKGTTRILIHSNKGKELFDNIKDNFTYIEVKPEELTKGVKEMFKSVKMNKKRTAFFEDINQINEGKFFNKYFPDSLKVKCERIIRKKLAKTRIYKGTKKAIKKILRKG